MKVLYPFGGMPHYLVSILSKLQTLYNVEIVTVLPSSQSTTMGAGVKQVNSGFNFKIIYSNETKGLFGKLYFNDLSKIIKLENPDIIVLGWPYIINFTFDKNSQKLVKKNNIGVIYRELPFMVAPYNKALSYYKKNPLFDENLVNTTPKGLKYYFWAFGMKIVRKIYYSKVDATNVYTIEGKNLQITYGVEENKIFVIGNSPDTEQIAKTKANILENGEMQKADLFSLIHIGRLVKWKKVDMLIQAVANLKVEFPSVKLKIIGTGPELENLMKLVTELNLENNVEFLGGIYDYENLGKQLIKSSIYVLAGMGGLSLNEAMAFGKPIICSVCDGTEKFLVRNNENGLFFENNDLTDLTEKIRFLFKNPQLIESFGKESERVIIEEENILTVLNKMYKTLEFVFLKKKKNEENN